MTSSGEIPGRQFRMEHDALGPVEVPAEHLWGAQTERCVHHFAIGGQRFRWNRPVIWAFGLLKQSAAIANRDLGRLDPEKAEWISRAAAEVLVGNWDSEFPLSVFQTGSGTQTNMNANEVIANRARQLSAAAGAPAVPIHPNDDVNRGQSSNDAFPTVMHLAILQQCHADLVPALSALCDTLKQKSIDFEALVMVGRTHLQDAVPVTLGQVCSGWMTQLEQARQWLETSLTGLHELAIGGTAVGTGLNAHPEFGATTARLLSLATGWPLVTAANKFAALAAHDAIVNVSGSLRLLAGALLKIANDVRWYASGPRAGIGELILPENEPGSSIMPGKINPTQCEALTMIAVQVFGNDHTVAFAGSQGNFQLNVFKPVMLHNVLESIELLSAGCQSFRVHCVDGIEPNRERIEQHLQSSLMLATALNPHVGYEKAAEIALLAHREKLTLRDAALRSGDIAAADFDQWVRPAEMTGRPMS